MTKTILLLLIVWLIKLSIAPAVAAEKRIITLSPHLAEIVYLLGEEDALVAVSEASNYPLDVLTLPTVANYRGIDLPAIAQLQPTHILAWQGGNKPQDIAKLRGLGIDVLSVDVQTLEDIAIQIEDVAEFLGNTNGAELAADFRQAVSEFSERFNKEPLLNVFYYSWPKPLQSIGTDAWVTMLLSECRLNHIFADLPIAYPQVSLASVLQAQPEYVISASGEEQQTVEQFWQAHEDVFSPKIILADPDKMHRFTPRVLDALNHLCEAARLNN